MNSATSSTMNPAIASRIPLVCRSKPPGLPLATRIADLTALTSEPDGLDHHQRVARASGVLNFAALIASDTGLPGLAADLCWRQHTIFAQAGSLTEGIAVMSLMPLVNIARLLIREGDGEAAIILLQQLYQAAQQRTATVIAGHDVDLAPLIHNDDDHRTICTELWLTLLIDGARALACSGRWSQAADTMAAHRGIGNRLLDGRQITIMALLQQGHADQAIAMIDTTIPAEPWETTVAALLRLCCQPPVEPCPPPGLLHAVRDALTLVIQPEPMTAAFRARLGLTTLDLTAERSAETGSELADAVTAMQAAVLDVATCDAYAARDVLAHPVARAHMTRRQEDDLAAVVTAAGLGARTLNTDHHTTLTSAVDTAENRLRALLASEPPQATPRAP
ncbi:hypothetical protein AB0M95_35265 [Sphaerisporangium sp. NPDC051017]|uniref:hypothetical protein n=1 Tax=Sphaerisporangium sp. NPDC051017 TaxID=3154636 RepID=UPI003448C05A